jgi:hypothetical protein
MAEPGGSSGRTQGIARTWPPRGAAQAGLHAPTGFSVWSPFIETLRSWARAEAGAGRLLPWVPVAFGTGIACYFAQPIMNRSCRLRQSRPLWSASLPFCCGGGKFSPLR